jgi:hypothetical protein
MAEKSRRDKANRQQKLGLVWRNRKKISQNIKDYFYLPFFLLIILCLRSSTKLPARPGFELDYRITGQSRQPFSVPLIKLKKGTQLLSFGP